MTAARPGCGVTVLRTTGSARATKRWQWNPTLAEWGKVSYEAGARFTACEHPIASLAELVDVLDTVRRDPRAMVVRGELTPEARERIGGDPEATINRRKLAKQDPRTKRIVTPDLAEVSRRWLMIDIDGWPLPASADLADDPEGAIETAIYELLPPAFHDAACWWQLSSSAGFVPGFLKAHLWYWLTEPAANPHVKAVLEQHAPGVDRAPFQAVQPHFVADPIIEGGHDPLPRRTGWRLGLEEAVVLPALVPVVRASRPAGAGGGNIGGRDVDDALAALGHGEGGKGFHEPLRAATLRYARRAARYGGRDDEPFKAKLREAIRAAPVRPGSASVETPYCEDYYLQSLIDGAANLVAGDGEMQAMRPRHRAPAQTVEEARAAVREHTAGFLQRAGAWHRLDAETRGEPEHAALVVSVGGGKSTITREELPAFIEEMKAERLPHRVLWLVPTHKLAEETLAAMLALGIHAAALRGRDAKVPEFVASEGDDAEPERMCLDLEAVGDAIAIGSPIEQSVCGSKKPDEMRCPFRDQCRYQKQKFPVSRADVVIATHQSIFNELAKEARRGLGVVVVDEAWWRAGLNPNREIRLADFADEPLQHPVVNKEKIGKGEYRYVRADMDTNDLHTFSARAQAAFSATEDKALVSQADARAAGVTAADCRAAHKLEWRRKQEGGIYPGMSPEGRRAAVERCAGNAGIPRRAGAWKALEMLLDGEATHTGRLQAGTRTDKEGSHRIMALHSRSDVQDAIAELPIIYLDATAPVQLVHHYLPRMEVLAEVHAAAPHMTVTQVVGGWGKTSLVPNRKAEPAENARREDRVRELADFMGLQSHGNGLVVTYQAIEAEFAARPGVRASHFNAQRGLDAFNDVHAVAVVGRPLPDPRELRELAFALTGRPVALEQGAQEQRGVLMADGSGAAVNVRAYTDPDLEALRVAVTEAEVIQSIGRGRGINRGAEDPLAVFLLADIVAPLPVNRLVRWDDLRPNVMERMLGRGAVLHSPVDASKAYPDLFPTPKAAEHAIGRAKGDLAPISLWIYNHRGMGGKSPALVSYRPAGRGQQTRTALVTADRLPGFREWLETLLGPLGFYEAAETPDTPQDAPRPAPGRVPAPAAADEPPPWEPGEADLADLDGWPDWQPAYADHPAARSEAMSDDLTPPAGGLSPVALYSPMEAVAPLDGVWTIRSPGAIEAVFTYARRPPLAAAPADPLAELDPPNPWSWRPPAAAVGTSGPR